MLAIRGCCGPGASRGVAPARSTSPTGAEARCAPSTGREGEYHAYVYVTGAGDLRLEMPATAGDYELRLCEADSPYKTMVAKPITVSGANASVPSSRRMRAASSTSCCESSACATPTRCASNGWSSCSARHRRGLHRAAGGHSPRSPARHWIASAGANGCRASAGSRRRRRIFRPPCARYARRTSWWTRGRRTEAVVYYPV